MLSLDSAFFEGTFNILNKIYFEDKLPRIIITIQSSPKSYGYITVNKVWRDNEASYHEINISAEYLNRNIEDVLSTLMHEMVHLYCIVNGIADTSNGGRYHNKKFKEEAEKRDLIIKYVKNIGYSNTKPSEKFINVLKENNLYSDINHYRTTGNSIIVPPSNGDNNLIVKKKTSTRKYICNSCGMSVRATKDVNIICGNCMNIMIKVN